LVKETGTGVKWAVVDLGGCLFGTSESPCELTGTGATIDQDTWDINEPPEDTDGVKLIVGQRLYWSGTEGDPVYYFTRVATFDSSGRLVKVDAEVSAEPFDTAACEE
jgi:hypothetical protein